MQAGWLIPVLKGALSPALPQAHLPSKSFDFISSRIVRTKPSSCRPGPCPHPQPANLICSRAMRHHPPGSQNSSYSDGTHEVWSIKRPPSCYGVSTDNPDSASFPWDHGQHGSCPLEKDMAGRWQLLRIQQLTSLISLESSRSWLSTRSGTNISMSADANTSSSER